MEVYKITTSVAYRSSTIYPEDRVFHKRAFTDNSGIIIHDPDSNSSYLCMHSDTQIFLGTEEAIAILKDSKINLYTVDGDSTMWGEINYFTMRRDATGVFHARDEECPGFNLILGPPDLLTHELFCRAARFFGLVRPRYVSSQPKKQAISELATYLGYFGQYPV